MAHNSLRRALVGASTLLCTSALVVLPALGASAIDYDVDDSGGASYTDIQSALTAGAGTGVSDRILVAAGAYTGFTVAPTVTDLQIIGAGTASTVITGTVVLNAPTEISGFTIQGQAAAAPTVAPFAPSAIQMYDGSEGSYIHDNVLQNAYHGVYMEGVDAPGIGGETVIADNQILGIHADQGSGVWISNSSWVEVTGNTFENTVADPNAVGVNLQCNTFAVTIDDNEFTNLGNAVVGIAAGSCNPISGITISNNEVDGFAGSGAFYFGGNNIFSVDILDNTVKNTTNAAGALVKFSDLPFFKGTNPGTSPISNFVIDGNTFSDAPYGVLVQPGVDATSTGIEVTDNSFCRISIEEIDDQTPGGAVSASGNIFTCSLPTLPGGTGGGSASGQLTTLADTGSEGAPLGAVVAALIAAIGVALVVRSRRVTAESRHG